MAPRLFVALAAMWMVAMTARLYPGFKDAIRVDGRITTVSAYLAAACGARVGPEAAACLEKRGTASRLLLRREQAKSILAIIVPLLGFFVVWPLRRLRAGVAAAWPHHHGRGIFPNP